VQVVEVGDIMDFFKIFRKAGIYNIEISYEDNKKLGPRYDGKFPKVSLSNKVDFFGYKIGSNIGIPAGPLLDSNWVNFYANFGYPILTYKTVRSKKIDAHPFPNVLFVKKDGYLRENDVGDIIYTFDIRKEDEFGILGITNSFGVPSLSPDEWGEDIKKANSILEEWQILVVSVMGTINGSNKDELLEDYIKVSKMAYHFGAKIIEVNLSCPNIGKEVGALYQDSKFAFFLADELKKAINVPFIFKVGYFPSIDTLAEFIKSVGEKVSGIAGINSIRMKVLNNEGKPALSPNRVYSGVCGPIIRKLGLYFIEQLAMIREHFGYGFRIIGMGGVSSPTDIDAFIEKGADYVMSATYIMWDPFLAYNYYLQKGII